VAATDLTVDGITALSGSVDLVVSTLPAGAADHLAQPLAAVPALFDVIYHPWPTPLAAASGPGRISVTGLDMLLHQAFRQFELFTGRLAPRQAMRQGLLTASATELLLPID
jgi:shikimate dehydrogenase